MTGGVAFPSFANTQNGATCTGKSPFLLDTQSSLSLLCHVRIKKHQFSDYGGRGVKPGFHLLIRKLSALCSSDSL